MVLSHDGKNAAVLLAYCRIANFIYGGGENEADTKQIF